MFYPSLFDSFFAPTRVIVVSEERLQAAVWISLDLVKQTSKLLEIYCPEKAREVN